MKLDFHFDYKQIYGTLVQKNIVVFGYIISKVNWGIFHKFFGSDYQLFLQSIQEQSS